jgi:hypothetical protein
MAAALPSQLPGGLQLCQAACPENRTLLDWREPGAGFREAEMPLLLAGLNLQQLPPILRAKVEGWDPGQWYDGLPRNLQAVLRAAG